MRPRVAFVVVDDGLYTHRWVAPLLADPRLEPIAAACLSPWRAPGFNPGRARGLFGATAARLRYYGLRDSALFAVRWAAERGSVRAAACGAGAKLLEPPEADVNDSTFCAELRELKPDLLLCAFSQRAGAALLSVPRLGCLNVHFSLLPEHRGREPLFHALLAGKGAGVSFQWMTDGLDAGAVVAQRALDLSRCRTLDEAIHEACAAAAKLAPEAILAAASWTGRREAAGPLPALSPWPGAEEVRRFRARGLGFA